jgi:aminoglycoside phosphotransferase family enzyme/predicted kinase
MNAPFHAEDHLAALADPACYPHPPDRVTVLQTHLSVVCLAGDFVYKLKKARALPFVDCTTLAARRHFCREEVRLNRRLCPSVYLGTAALRRTAAGALQFAATGDDAGPADLDTAVVMQRLPAARMLDQLVAAGSASSNELADLGRCMAAFHAGAERTPEVARQGAPERLGEFASDNFAALAGHPALGPHAPLLAALAKASATGFARVLPALRARAARGCIVDGHGDLHCRNICLTTPPTVYDCIEFAPAFRCGDVATENAFLVMDLRYRRAPELARAYLGAYTAASGDHDQAALLPWLCAYRALVRAKVAALAQAEPELPADDRAAAADSVGKHLELAAGLLLESRAPLWVAVAGPPATGKSTLGEELQQRFGWPHHRTDALRKQLAGLPEEAPAPAALYCADATERTYAALAAAARRSTAEGAAVVLLDGNFARRAQRAALRAAAQAAGAALGFAVLQLDVAAACRRAALRRPGPGQASDADAAVTARLHREYEWPGGDEGDGRVVPAAAPDAVLRAQVLAHLLDAVTGC